MKVKISSTFQASAGEMWEELQKVSTLMYVAYPLLVFKPRDGGSLPERWDVGKEYSLMLFLFGRIPLGPHFITIFRIDHESMEILSKEHGGAARTWNHFMKIEARGSDELVYQDEIEIRAGVLTIFVWAFAQIFYRHRHRRWRSLFEG